MSKLRVARLVEKSQTGLKGQSERSQARLLWIGAFLLSLSFGIIAWLLVPRKSIDEGAKDVYLDLLRGNERALDGALLPVELKNSNLSREQLHRLVGSFIIPKLRSIKFIKIAHTRTQAGGAQGFVDGLFALPSGVEVHSGLVATVADEGPVCRLNLIIADIWRIEDMEAFNKNEVNRFQAMVDGIQRDRQRLTALGLDGLSETDHPEHIATWDEIRTHCEQVLANERAFISSNSQGSVGR